MNRDYINWLESLPCNSRRLKVNQWMSEWAPLPNEIDLSRYEAVQQQWNQRDCPSGVMAKIFRTLGSRRQPKNQ